MRQQKLFYRKACFSPPDLEYNNIMRNLQDVHVSETSTFIISD